jgi:hypothetical protein
MGYGPRAGKNIIKLQTNRQKKPGEIIKETS